DSSATLLWLALSEEEKDPKMARKKKVAGLIKLQIEAGAASPAPPVGPALGQHGVNMMEFVKAYNAETESMRGNIVPAGSTVSDDRSVSLITTPAPASQLITKAARIAKAARTPRAAKLGKSAHQHAQEIAETKKRDVNAKAPHAATRIAAGTG